MAINITTPALLFPAISLLLLAYTNRFLSIASLIRHLHAAFHENGSVVLETQVVLLQRRIKLIQKMQWLGVLSLFLCVICMFLLFINQVVFGEVLFAISLISLISSLFLSMKEISLSADALTISLQDME